MGPVPADVVDDGPVTGAPASSSGSAPTGPTGRTWSPGPETTEDVAVAPTGSWERTCSNEGELAKGAPRSCPTDVTGFPVVRATLGSPSRTSAGVVLAGFETSVVIAGPAVVVSCVGLVVFTRLTSWFPASSLIPPLGLGAGERPSTEPRGCSITGAENPAAATGAATTASSVNASPEARSFPRRENLANGTGSLVCFCPLATEADDICDDARCDAPR